MESGYTILNRINEAAATRIAQRVYNNERAITTRTIIDLFITDRTNYAYNLSQVGTPLSDHNQMLLSIDNIKANDFVTIESQVSIQKVNNNDYNNELHTFLSESNVDSFSDLISGIKDCLDNNTQNLTITRKSNPEKPWITEKILSLMEERKRYFMLRNKSPSNEFLINKYNEICETINKERYTERTKFNSTAINNNLNNPKKNMENIK